jgi:hypothetical protein
VIPAIGAMLAAYVITCMVDLSSSPPPRGAKYCQRCGTVATPTRRTKGSFLIEVFLWLMLLIPGLIYSLWRLTSKAWVCPKCGSEDIIPLDSPKARAALEQRSDA